jgi:hypothetical protein
VPEHQQPTHPRPEPPPYPLYHHHYYVPPLYIAIPRIVEKKRFA